MSQHTLSPQNTNALASGDQRLFFLDCFSATVFESPGRLSPLDRPLAHHCHAYLPPPSCFLSAPLAPLYLLPYRPSILRYQIVLPNRVSTRPREEVVSLVSSPASNQDAWRKLIVTTKPTFKCTRSEELSKFHGSILEKYLSMADCFRKALNS